MDDMPGRYVVCWVRRNDTVGYTITSYEVAMGMFELLQDEGYDVVHVARLHTSTEYDQEEL